MNEADSYIITLRQENNINCQFLLLPRSKIRQLVSTVTPTRWVHCQCFKLFSARRSQILIKNCALLLILAKRIPIMKNTGPELSIATITNVRAINVGDIDRMTDIARPGNITTHTNKVKSGGQRPRYDSRQTSGQHVRCYECQRTGHVARFCPSHSTQSNSQGNQWHTPQWKQCYEDQQRQLRQLQG